MGQSGYLQIEELMKPINSQMHVNFGKFSKGLKMKKNFVSCLSIMSSKHKTWLIGKQLSPH
jgi:hypothetical protein